MTDLTLASARPEHGPVLNRLIVRSKAYWGYDDEMMNIMARVLRLDPDAMKAGRAMAGWRDGEPLGVAQISEPHEDSRGRAMELDLLFISPQAIGTGLALSPRDVEVQEITAQEVIVRLNGPAATEHNHRGGSPIRVSWRRQGSKQVWVRAQFAAA